MCVCFKIQSNLKEDSIIERTTIILSFSYDARSGGGISDVGRRWSDDRAFGLRGHFQVKPHPALLHVEDIQAAEAGVYRCRVDFKTAPTRNSLVNLTVISEYRSQRKTLQTEPITSRSSQYLADLLKVSIEASLLAEVAIVLDFG